MSPKATTRVAVDGKSVVAVIAAARNARKQTLDGLICSRKAATNAPRLRKGVREQRSGRRKGRSRLRRHVDDFFLDHFGSEE